MVSNIMYSCGLYHAAYVGSFFTDVSDQVVREKFFLHFLTNEDGTDRLCRKSVNNYKRRLRNNQEEQRPHLHYGGSLRSRIMDSYFKCNM